MGKKNYVCVPRDEYDELIEYKLHINALYEFITKKHANSIKACVHKCELSPWKLSNLLVDIMTMKIISTI
jgi:hypothetical protein|nr:MAG TPA: hypothetical protein [Caudoviricetes sp.]